jgi:hypothetical protein
MCSTCDASHIGDANLAKGHILRSLGQSRNAPGISGNVSGLANGHIQRLSARLIMAVGQSNNSTNGVPGALPLATLIMALGQHAAMFLVRNRKEEKS